MIFDPVIPLIWIAAIAIMAVILTAVFYLRCGRRLSGARRAVLLTFRLAGLCGTIFLLLQPSRERKIPAPVVEKQLVIALDVSKSMREAHSTGAARIDAVRTDLEKSGLLAISNARFFTFADKATPVTPDAIGSLGADGDDTKFDHSVATILRMASQPQPAGLIVLSDGHDFGLVPPAETARRARSRGVPIFTVPYGTQEEARDVSIRLAGFYPHTFLRQTTQLEAVIRVTACPHENLVVQLKRDGKPVDKKVIRTNNQPYHNVSFPVVHEEAGQYEYTFEVTPVGNERELSNNRAFTFLNVISERIRILEIEGRPFWDSTFLRRSFARNDKFEIDSLVAFTGDRVRPLRSNPEKKTDDLKPPTSVQDLAPYDMVILGRETERVIGEAGLRAIADWTKNRGGIVVFSRGQAWGGGISGLDEMEPIRWDLGKTRGSRLEVTPQAGSVGAFRLLREVAAEETFPEIVAFAPEGAPRTLAATFSVSPDQQPAIVYRRYGAGQTISLGVANLWRWVFNPKANYDNNAYDRFWDQLALWLLASGGSGPVQGYQLRAENANVPLGETVRIRLTARGKNLPARPQTLRIFHDGQEVTSLSMTSENDENMRVASFTPRDAGRYSAELTAPDGKKLSTRFIALRDDLETVESSLDRVYLDELARNTGGRMIEPEDIASLAEELLRGTGARPPLVRREPLWDNARVFYLLGFLLCADWYLRRRWGLA
ncbi:MAG: hypothetical protein V4733_04850 [Verrucomicrobiota bacterium]